MATGAAKGNGPVRVVDGTKIIGSPEYGAVIEALVDAGPGGGVLEGAGDSNGKEGPAEGTIKGVDKEGSPEGTVEGVGPPTGVAEGSAESG